MSRRLQPDVIAARRRTNSRALIARSQKRGQPLQAEGQAQQRFLGRLYWWSFFIRFSVGMLGWGLVLMEVPIDIVQDAAFYETAGANVAKEWLSGRSSETLTTLLQRPHFPWLIVVGIACFYTMTLGLRLLPLLIAAYCAITACVPGVLYRITRLTGGGHRAAAIAGWLAALCPAIVYWSSTLYKEGVILFFLAQIGYQVIRLQQRYEARAVTVLLISLVALTALRVYLALIAALAVALGLAFVRVERGSTATVMVRQILAITIVGVMGVAAYGLSHFHEEIPTSLDEGLFQVGQVRRGLTLADSGYLHDVDVSDVSGAIDAMPQSVLYFLTVPWPTQNESLRQVMAIPDTAVWVVLYLFVLLGAVQALSRNPQAVLLLVAMTVGLTCFYGMLVGNIGTAYRMRVQVWLFWCPLVGIGLESLLPRPRIASPRRLHANRVSSSNDAIPRPSSRRSVISVSSLRQGGETR